jgi:hypothetical protein
MAYYNGKEEIGQNSKNHSFWCTQRAQTCEQITNDFPFYMQQTTLGKVRIYVQKHRFSSTPSNILFHGVLENLCFCT